jgi:hypothetical protein
VAAPRNLDVKVLVLPLATPTAVGWQLLPVIVTVTGPRPGGWNESDYDSLPSLSVDSVRHLGLGVTLLGRHWAL